MIYSPLFVLLHSTLTLALFYPDFTDYDAYGIKIAANSLVLVQAKNQDKIYFLKFAPYNYTNTSLQCALGYIDPTHYIYSVAVGSSQALTNQPYVYYAGAVASTNGVDGDKYGRKGTFIAILINRDNASVQSYIDSGKPMSCSKFSIPSILFLPMYGHQEYFVIAAEPTGKFAMGLAIDFVFQYRPFSSSLMTNRSASAVWPNNATFYPCAADATESFTIVAGFVKNSMQSKARATPTVHLLWNDNLTVLSSWTYAAAENSWQSYLTYSGLDSWNKKFTMSVKTNGDDSTRVLIGMPFLNTVFLFRVTNNGTNLSMTGSMSYEESVGFGKSVTWLPSTRAAILYSAYSLDYSTWQSSKVHVFDWSNDTHLSPSPIAVIPNAQQPLPTTINAELIRVMSTPTDLGILDRAGGVLLMLSEPPGSYPSTDMSNSKTGTAMPVISRSTPCISGTFKADTGIHPCSLCPVGSRNSGAGGAAVACVNCSADAFCPLGAAYEVDSAYLTSLSQAYSYPRSPEMTVYEDVLINNMVTFGSTAHCLRVSPMFWTLVLLLIILAILIAMASLNFCVQEPKRTEWRMMVKSIFLRTDLVVSDTFGGFLHSYLLHRFVIF